MKIIVTGGAGYIGSHTIVDLLENGYEVVCADNLSRSSDYSLKTLEKITGKNISFYKLELCDKEATAKFFEEHADAKGVIHFAALKSVPESVENPLLYYENNLNSLLHVLEGIARHRIPSFVFSSSCSVYGNADELPVAESTPIKEAESPYAHTKQIGEEIIRHWNKSSACNSILLRYFNPIGAHPSALIGEMPIDKPNNLVPFITQSAIGKLGELTVYGSDYPTRDGSCVRDYIHVCDIAHAHTLAIQYAMNNHSFVYEIFNLGTGNGVTVFEVIRAFESATRQKLNYIVGGRRNGDVVAVYADNSKANKLLGWHCAYSLDDAMLHAWKWEQTMQKFMQ